MVQNQAAETGLQDESQMPSGPADKGRLSFFTVRARSKTWPLQFFFYVRQLFLPLLGATHALVYSACLAAELQLNAVGQGLGASSS